MIYAGDDFSSNVKETLYDFSGPAVGGLKNYGVYKSLIYVLLSASFYDYLNGSLESGIFYEGL